MTAKAPTFPQGIAEHSIPVDKFPPFAAPKAYGTWMQFCMGLSFTRRERRKETLQIPYGLLQALREPCQGPARARLAHRPNGTVCRGPHRQRWWCDACRDLSSWRYFKHTENNVGIIRLQSLNYIQKRCSRHISLNYEQLWQLYWWCWIWLTDAFTLHKHLRC